MTLRGIVVGSSCLAADLYPFREGHSTDQTLPARSTSNTPRGTQPDAGSHRSRVTRRAGYGAAPPGIKGRCAIAARRPAAVLDPGASTAPDRPTAGAGQGCLPRGARRSLRDRFCAKASRSHLAALPDRGPHHPATASGHSRRVHLGASTTPDTKGLNRRVRLIVNRAYGDLTPQTQALGLVMLTLGPIDHVLRHERTTPADP